MNNCGGLFDTASSGWTWHWNPLSLEKAGTKLRRSVLGVFWGLKQRVIEASVSSMDIRESRSTVVLTFLVLLPTQHILPHKYYIRYIKYILKLFFKHHPTQLCLLWDLHGGSLMNLEDSIVACLHQMKHSFDRNCWWATDSCGWWNVMRSWECMCLYIWISLSVWYNLVILSIVQKTMLTHTVYNLSFFLCSWWCLCCGLALEVPGLAGRGPMGELHWSQICQEAFASDDTSAVVVV